MARKKLGRFTTADIVHHLRKENVYLRKELVKITDLCTKLAGNITNNNVQYPLNLTTPAQTSPDTPPVRPKLSSRDAEFILPRRAAKPCKRLQNSWDPTVALRNSYSPLAERIDSGEEEDVITTSGEMREKRANRPAKVQANSNGKRPSITTTEKHLANFVPIVPGRRSYASTTNGRGTCHRK